MQLDLYQDRPGFQFPYEGPTLPGSPDPEGWEAFGLKERLEHRLARFEDSDAVVGPVVGGS